MTIVLLCLFYFNLIILNIWFVFSGLKFFISKQNQLYDLNTSTEQEIRHARMWYILLQTLKVDILIQYLIVYNECGVDITKEENKLSHAEKVFFESHDSFPSSAVLLFRRYFLDKVSTYIQFIKY